MKKIIIILSLLFVTIISNAQVGIGTTLPNPAAALDIESKGERGILIPAIDNFGGIDARIDSLSSPDDIRRSIGMLVFYKPHKRFYMWDGTNWQCLNPYSTDTTSRTINPLNPNYQTITGNFEGTARLNGDFTGPINSEFNGYGSIPVGGIIMWSGTNPPPGWVICNGQIVNGITTPNLSNRFILGSFPNTGGSPGDLSQRGTNPGETGGSNTVILSTTQVPLRSHTHAIQGNTESDGAHQHVARTTLTMEETSGTNRTFLRLNVDEDNNTAVLNKNDGAHSHLIDFNSQVPNETFTVAAHENRPAYYVLAFIMRIR